MPDAELVDRAPALRREILHPRDRAARPARRLLGQRVEAIAAEAGLRVAQVIPGFWSEPDGVAVNEQDLVLFERA